MNPIEMSIELLIKPFEGYNATAYPDPGTHGSPWTIGWGSTGHDIVPGVVWTREQAEQRLLNAVSTFYYGLLQLSPKLGQASEPRQAALISFAYNCGLGNYRISTLRKRVEVQDWNGAATEIVKWNKAAGRVMAGLTRRRMAEAALLKEQT